MRQDEPAQASGASYVHHFPIRRAQVEIHHAPETIRMDDKPMQAIKSKKDASMMVALEMVKNGNADAMLSTGNTKVLVGAGTLKLRPMPGADRPALAAIMPHLS